MKSTNIAAALLVLTTGISACASLPDQIEEVEQARLDVEIADRHPLSDKVAGSELLHAKEALAAAEAEIRDNGELEDIRHHAYIASRHAEIVMERVAEQEALEQIDDAKVARANALLEARELEAQQAIELAEAKAREAEIQRHRAEVAAEEAASLRNLVSELEAEKTERGLVLTMGDVLFDTDRAELKPGAIATMDRLASFLREYPDYALIIEGHTDATGEDSYNLALSDRRANTVRNALVARGISSERLNSVGMGEAYPVASNDTAAGRQQNRRVEIVISDSDGNFPEAAQRTAAIRQ